MRNEISQIKNECSETRNLVEDVKKEQESMNSRIQNQQHEINVSRSLQENLQLDVDSLHKIFDARLNDIGDIKERVEYIERETIKDKARIFELKDYEHETNLQLKHKVLKDVLNTACPDLDFQLDDIKYAQRIGPFRVDFDRMVLVTFRYDDDKHRVFQGREALRNVGIRVSDELTKAQRAQLKSAKSRGILGYFYRGKFYERENSNYYGAQTDQHETNQLPRTFKKKPCEEQHSRLSLQTLLRMRMKHSWKLKTKLLKPLTCLTVKQMLTRKTAEAQTNPVF